MRFYNTLSRKIEEFRPINPPYVGMYTCGPTVYDYQHIGNFRTMMLSDILVRVLKYNGYEVKSVRNVTDIDDKIIAGAAQKNVSISDFSKEFTRVFFEDLEKLNILPVSVNTYATEYIPKMVSYISELLAKGYAYVEDDGSVYFSIAKFPGYGKLSKVNLSGLKTGTRILSDEYTKDLVQDFALWKKMGSKERGGYDSPWGKGRPGWHIECSVMSQDNLGDTFDIHVGGRDLKFPHHENEIAQAEVKTGKPFVNYWVHGEFLNVDGGKMSKSLKNFYTIKDVEEKGFEPLTLRYFYLTAHYRKLLNFTWEALEGAQKALDRLREKYAKLASQELLLRDQFLEAINDDLNMPQALAVAWKTESKKDLEEFDKVLGLRLGDLRELRDMGVPEEIKKLLDEREKLRGKKKFAEADEIRDKIIKKGYAVEDNKI
ncbi:MAG: cysteine--tRNA ligase [Patescibacteria group bacterium]